jgi:hypothetical protein
MPSIKIDDILAALILSLAMMRRIEARSASAEQSAHLTPAAFEHWRARALRAYDLVSIASGAKVVLSLGWFALATRLGVPAPWFQLFGGLVFVVWMGALLWAWKLATDARYLRLQLGIELKRRAPPADG